MLLAAPLATLSPAERTTALDAGFRAGRDAASGPVDPADLEKPRPLEYYIHVIAPLHDDGRIGEKVAAGWKLQCLDHRALEDPRVQAFFHGWHQRAAEILREIAEAAPGPDAVLRRILDETAPHLP